MAQPRGPSSEALLADAVPVGQFVHGLRRLLKEEPTLQRQSIRGEISRWSRARSGHVYLTLRDDDGAIDAVMWASKAPHMDFQEGQEVVAVGSIDLYPPRGQLQFSVDSLRRVDRLGELEAQRRRLVEQLRAEGVLDRPRRPLPWPPKHVAVVIGSNSAAEADVLRLSEDRWPGLRRTVVGVLVQGDGAAEELERGLNLVARLADPAVAEQRGQPPVDAIILGRGGGSVEDLWAFNLERVARAVLRMPVPVISAVGHETDVLVTDLVADVRASTPSDAVERLVPVRSDLEQHHDGLEVRLYGSAKRRVNEEGQRLQLLRHRLAGGPSLGLSRASRALDLLSGRLGVAVDASLGRERGKLAGIRTALEVGIDRRLARERNAMTRLEATLLSTDPRQVMERGYGMVARTDGRLVSSISHVAPGDGLMVHLADGSASTTVDKVEGGKPHDG